MKVITMTLLVIGLCIAITSWITGNTSINVFAAILIGLSILIDKVTQK